MLRDLFSKRQQRDEVRNTRVLVCSLNPKFDELAADDSKTYSKSYPAITTAPPAGIDDCLKIIGKGYDIVHLFADVSSAGLVADPQGKAIMGTELIQHCCDSDVKLLWVASDNNPDGYIKGFKAAGKRLNLVMTIDRRGSKFSTFLEQLTSRMAAGETMPAAWVAISPQASGHARNLDSPATIFSAGRASAKLR